MIQPSLLADDVQSMMQLLALVSETCLAAGGETLRYQLLGQRRSRRVKSSSQCGMNTCAEADPLILSCKKRAPLNA
jgi:hypothetical protein